MAKVTIKNIDGKECAVATVDFNLGEISDERNSPENATLMGMNVDGMEKFYKQALYERAENSTFEDHCELLEQYVSFRLQQIIGVESNPIKRNKDGVLEGFGDEVEVLEDDGDNQ